MKKISILLLNVLLAGVVMLSSCKKDDEEPVAPSISLIGDGGLFIDKDATIKLDENGEAYAEFKLNIEKKDNNVDVLTIKDGQGSILAANRIFVGDSETPVAANPISINNSGQNIEIAILFTSVGSTTIEFEVKDNKSLTNKRSVTITVEAEGTAVEAISGSLISSAGPAGTGGINLSTGASTGSSDGAAHLKDEGGALGAWEKQFSSVNGSTIKTPAAGTTFAGITTKEQIASAYAAGANAPAVIDAAVDNEYIVKNGDDYFFVKITAVTNPASTTDNNDNKTTFDIKK